MNEKLKGNLAKAAIASALAFTVTSNVNATTNGLDADCIHDGTSFVTDSNAITNNKNYTLVHRLWDKTTGDGVCKNVQTPYYNVAYNANGGSGTMENSRFEYGAAVNIKTNSFTRTGYTFKNWNTASNGSGTALNNGALVQNELLCGSNNCTKTLYAQGNTIPYSISYTLNGGTLSGQKTSYTIEDSYTLPAPTRSNYTFTGWTGSNGSTPQTSVTISKGSTGNKSYSANGRINTVYGYRDVATGNTTLVESTNYPTYYKTGSKLGSETSSTIKSGSSSRGGIGNGAIEVSALNSTQYDKGDFSAYTDDGDTDPFWFKLYYNGGWHSMAEAVNAGYVTSYSIGGPHINSGEANTVYNGGSISASAYDWEDGWCAEAHVSFTTSKGSPITHANFNAVSEHRSYSVVRYTQPVIYGYYTPATGGNGNNVGSSIGSYKTSPSRMVGYSNNNGSTGTEFTN